MNGARVASADEIDHVAVDSVNGVVSVSGVVSVNSVASGVPGGEVEVDGSGSQASLELHVDGVCNEDYVVEGTGTSEPAFGFFFSDSSESGQSPTDVVSVEFDWDGRFRTAFIERSGEFRQIVRSFCAAVRSAAGQRRRVLVASAATVTLLGALVLAPTSAAADDYRVEAGDSLWSIAVANGVSVSELMEINDLTSTVVRPGDVLQIPDAPWSGATIEHEVLAGEALSLIAETYAVSVDDILDLNELADADLIRVGDVLAIPALSVDRGEEFTITVNHKVRSGQSLGQIAASYDVTVATIMTANALANPDLIVVGDVLEVPNVVPRTEQERLSAQFERFATLNELPVDLVKAVAWQESRWQDDAESSVGAMGIGQIMPGTSEFIQERLLHVEGLDPWDATDNIEMMTAYLRYLVDEFDGNVETALGAYYQGPGAVRSRGFYGETEVYVASVLAFHQRFIDGELPG